jgi:DNA (cytosine-5)-methyltransferase 1
MNYYNENDPKAAAWLRELIKASLIAPGIVDERSICDVQPDDVREFIQCHFFAGIGGWSYALRLAGWADDEPVWTGSCPCQPWSGANVWQGGGKGNQDERHLWPAWFKLIRKRHPSIIFGEQVPHAIKKGWLDEVFTDLESEEYARAAAVLRADNFGARHQRKRLYWMAYAGGPGRPGHFPIKCFPEPTGTQQPIHGDVLARASAALDGDFRDLLHCDGLSVVMERHAVKCYGNAIVPQVASQFIQAAREALTQLQF